MAAKWKFGCARWLLDRNTPRPRWLGLDPGELYLGSYPLAGMNWVILIGMIAGIVPMLIGVFGQDARWVMTAIAGPAISVAVVLVSRLYNRVHLTSTALVLKEHKRHRIIPISHVDGLSFDTNLDRSWVRLHYTDGNQPGTLELESHCPRQTAEEFAQLIARYGGKEIEVKGGRK